MKESVSWRIVSEKSEKKKQHKAKEAIKAKCKPAAWGFGMKWNIKKPVAIYGLS